MKSRRFYTQKRAGLLLLAGPNPTARQLALIHQAVRTMMRLDEFERREDEGRALARHDQQTIIAMARLLGQTLKEIEPPAPKGGGGPSWGKTLISIATDPDDPRVAAGTAIYLTEEEMRL